MRLLPVVFVALGVLAAGLPACGGGGQAADQPRMTNPRIPPPGAGPAADVGPPPRDMPGNGRSFSTGKGK